MTPLKILLPAGALSLAGLAALPALSSSEEAWEEFRVAVETECGKLVDAPDGAVTEIEVNPFGSQTYGVALVTVTLPDESADRMVCIYDKQAQTAEMTAPFATGSQARKGDPGAGSPRSGISRS